MTESQRVYFLTVAKIGNMSKASEILYVTQPTLSTAISRLEEEVGVKFFDRIGNNRIVLNRFGICFQNHLERMNAEYEDALRQISDMNDETIGTAHFSICGLNAYEDLLEEFSSIYPMARLFYSCYSLGAIENEKFKGTLDFALSYESSNDSFLEWTPIVDQCLVVLMHAGNHLAEKELIQPEELRNMKLALCSNDESYSQFIFNTIGLPSLSANLVYSGRSVELMLHYIDRDDTVCVMPEFEYLMLRSNDKYRCIVDGRAIGRRIEGAQLGLGFITVKNQYVSQMSHTLMNYLRSRILEIYEQDLKDPVRWSFSQTKELRNQKKDGLKS